MKRSALFSFVILLSFVIPQLLQAADFPDVSPSHPYYVPIHFVQEHQIAQGFPDGTFRPYQQITRGEVLKMIMRAAGYTGLAAVASDPFPDVSKSEEFAPYIQQAVDLGIVNGYEDGLFRMNRSVSRIEALKMVLLANRILRADLPQGESFSDVTNSMWYAPFARYAWDNHLLDPLPGNMLRPGDFIHRGMVADLLYRFYQLHPELFVTALPATSVPSSSPFPSAFSFPTPTTFSSSNLPNIPATSSSTTSPTLLRSVRLSLSPDSVSSPCTIDVATTITATFVTDGSGGSIRYRVLDNGVATSAERNVVAVTGQTNLTTQIPVNYLATQGVGLHVFTLVVSSPRAMVSESKTFSFVCHNTITQAKINLLDNDFQCDRDNTFPVDVQLVLDGTGPAGSVKYFWQRNNAQATDGPFELPYQAGATTLAIPSYPWLIPETSSNGEYSLFFFAVLPNAVVSSPVSITKNCP